MTVALKWPVCLGGATGHRKGLLTAGPAAPLLAEQFIAGQGLQPRPAAEPHVALQASVHTELYTVGQEWMASPCSLFLLESPPTQEPHFPEGWAHDATTSIPSNY